MNNLESRIRDYLADHLSLLEPGLELVQREFALKSELGAGGFIDILARDQHGHFVVIEVKRSNQAARSALHELTKYVALLRIALGIRLDQMRALLVSTEWHELAVPFGEYQKACEVPTEGRMIVAQENGVVTSSEVFVAPTLESPLAISRCQSILLYVHKADRDAALASLIATAKDSALTDFSIFNIDYGGENFEVIYPFGFYFMYSSPLPAGCEVPGYIKEMGWDDELEDLDENFLCFLMRDFASQVDTAEVGYPEKLSKIIQDGWHVVVAHRNGRYAANSALLSNEQLIAEAAKKEGGAAYYIERTVSPKYPLSWKSFGDDAHTVLVGNDYWYSIFPMLLRKAEANSISTVSVKIYNPSNILLALFALHHHGEARFFSGFQLLFSGIDEVKLYIGALGWNEEVPLLSAGGWINQAFGSVDDFMLHQHFNSLHTLDGHARNLLGITSHVFEINNPATPHQEISEIVIDDGNLVRIPFERTNFAPAMAFPIHNSQFCDALVEMISSIAPNYGK